MANIENVVVVVEIYLKQNRFDDATDLVSKHLEDAADTVKQLQDLQKAITNQEISVH